MAKLCGRTQQAIPHLQRPATTGMATQPFAALAPTLPSSTWPRNHRPPPDTPAGHAGQNPVSGAARRVAQSAPTTAAAGHRGAAAARRRSPPARYRPSLSSWDIAQGDLQQGRTPGVVQQAIGPGGCLQVQRPARRDPRCSQPRRPPSRQAASAAPPAARAGQSQRPTQGAVSSLIDAVKRTRSPMASGLGGVCRGSKRGSGQRPSKCQPPGEACG